MKKRQLDDDFAFIEKCNAGGESISSEQVARIQDIARQCWSDACGQTHPLLTENEAYNLSIQRGTLNPEERKIIEDHAVHTINMLSQISFPSPLRDITEYAAGHHERMDGKVYLDYAKKHLAPSQIDDVDIGACLSAHSPM